MTINSSTRKSRRGERGYIMLALLLIITLMAIFSAMLVTSISFDIKRDREEEMIHRGVQYSRAIRAYYKKFGRYPMKLEDLESTNKQRFLRKRYKDPLNCPGGKCQDFKLLHFGEAKLSMGAGIGGGMIPGASALGNNGQLNNPQGMTQVTNFGGNSGFGANANTGFGQSSQPVSSQNVAPDAAQPAPVAPGQPGTDAGPLGAQISPDGATANSNGSSTDKVAGATFGGAPIVGVASLSKKETIREFDHKKKYNEWQFVYDPMLEQGQGRLITTPYQPQLLQGFGQIQNANGNNSGQNGTGNGFGNSFGNQPSGMQNNPSSPVGGFGTQNPPSNPPPQQQ